MKVVPAKMKHFPEKNSLKKVGTLNDSIKLSFVSYYWLKIKRILFSKKSPDKFLQLLDQAEKIEKNIFNELTIYQLFFEVEKLKRLLLNNEQIKAFGFIKIKHTDLYKISSSSNNLKNILSGLKKFSDPISQKIVHIIEKKEINFH